MSDTRLRELLAGAAAAAPDPVSGPPAWLDAAAAGPEATTSARRWPNRLLAAAVVVLTLAIGTRVLDDPSSGPEVSSSGADVPAAATPTGGESGAAGSCPSCGTPAVGGPAAPAGAGATGGASTGAGATGAGGSAATGASGGALIAPLIVQRGTVELEVAEGAFSETLEQLTTAVTSLGGQVAATQTSEQGEHPRGTLTLRVPVAAFEPLLIEVRRLGSVLTSVTNSEDVTAGYADLESRLVALRATRDQLLLVLGQAEAIGDILAVQDRLHAVGVEIESLEGQRRVLADQAELATLAVTVVEPGDEAPAATDDGDGGLGVAWREARRGFGNALEWLVARSGKGLVVAAVALAALAAARLLGRRHRRAAL